MTSLAKVAFITGGAQGIGRAIAGRLLQDDLCGAIADSDAGAETAARLAGRVGTPDDIAALAAYLVSPQAGFITGANVVVDGGMTRKMIYV